MEDVLSQAVLNNARWCDTMCRLHGLEGRFGIGWWSVSTRPPTFYPDAVTLEPETSAPPILDSIDASPGCSVKDSYADLNLSPFGFRELFSARWIARSPDPRDATSGPDVPRFERVGDRDSLVGWERAWGGGREPIGLFRAELLEDENTAIIAGVRDGRLVAGGIAFVSASVVGLTNVFSTDDDLDAAWRGCSAVTTEAFPDVTIVGYERGSAFGAAERQGFRPIGPLRVWFKPDAP